MSPDYYLCLRCKKCLFDCWGLCGLCRDKSITEDEDFICDDCIDNKSFSKYRLDLIDRLHPLTVCYSCIKAFATKNYDDGDLEAIKQLDTILHPEEVLKTIEAHWEKYFGKKVQIRETEREIQSLQ